MSKKVSRHQFLEEARLARVGILRASYQRVCLDIRTEPVPQNQ